MSFSVSQSAVSPNAIVPPSDVQPIDSPPCSPSGIAGWFATSLAPPRYRGIWGAGMFETTRLNHRPRETTRAAMACSAGGAKAPRPMMASADIAIDDDLRSSVARRTFASRDRGLMPPIGISTNAGATRFPTSPASAFDRTETGTSTRRLRPFVDSPREARSSCRPIATAVSTTSLIVPPRTRLIVRSPSNGTSAVAKRRAGPVGPSKGPRGAAPMPASAIAPETVRTTVSIARWGARRAREHFGGMGRHLLEGRMDQIIARRDRLRSPRGGRRRSERCVRLEVEQSRSDQHAADPVRERVVKLQEDGRPSRIDPFEDVELPEGLRSIERSGEDAADRSLQLEPTAGGRNGRAAEVEVQIEPVIVHPHGSADIARNRKDTLSQSGCQMDPGLDDPLHIVVRERPVFARREDRQAGDVHVQSRGLEIEEARIQTGEAFRWHRPMLGSAPMGRRPVLHGMLAVTALIWFSSGSVATAQQEQGGSAAPRLPPGVGPGREPVPTGYAGTIRVPQDFDTIQAAVDHAKPGGMVLVAPGSIGSR